SSAPSWPAPRGAPEMTVMANAVQMTHATPEPYSKATQVVAPPQAAPPVKTATTTKPGMPPRPALLAAMVGSAALLIVAIGIFVMINRNATDSRAFAPLPDPATAGSTSASGSTTAGANAATGGATAAAT